MTPEEREAQPAYIGRCPECRRIIIAIVDTPDHRKDTAAECARAMREGYDVERTTVGAARAEDWFHTEGCPRDKTKRRKASKRKGAAA